MSAKEIDSYFERSSGGRVNIENGCLFCSKVASELQVFPRDKG